VPVSRPSMKRPRKTLSDYLAIAPWWISVLIAAFTYVLLRYMLPPFFDDPAIEAPASLLRFLAPYIAALLLIPLPFALFHREEHRILVESERKLDKLRDLELPQFAELLADGYRREGYLVEDLGYSGKTEKIDMMLRRGGEKTIVVCRRWRARVVSAKWARNVHAMQATYGAAGSHLVTCGTFSSSALRLARLSSIQLIDGRALLKLIGKPNRERVAQQDFDSIFVPQALEKVATEGAPSEPSLPADDAESPSCPRCGSQMVRDTGTDGISAGVTFWACIRAPACRGTRSG